MWFKVLAGVRTEAFPVGREDRDSRRGALVGLVAIKDPRCSSWVPTRYDASEVRSFVKLPSRELAFATQGGVLDSR